MHFPSTPAFGRRILKGFARSVRSPKFLTVAALAGVVAFRATPASANLVIDATFSSSITGLSNAAAVESTLNLAIANFESIYTSNVTVKITFNSMSSGLGQSSTDYTSETTAAYLAALTTHNSGDAIDTAALLKLGTNPYLGSTIGLTTANARALGFSASTSNDGTIGLNTGICFTGHSTPVGGEYDLFGVASHEIDEVLGTSSGVGGGFLDTDLFRYDGSGNRSFTSSTSVHAYLSVDGTTDIDEYNQFGRSNGDFGDWIIHNPPQVQDWAGTPGKIDNYGVGETDLLDAVGYNVAPAPEPASMALLGLGAAALLRRRFRK